MLARAVIGGVLVGTITTLLFVPYLYSVIGRFDERRRNRASRRKDGLMMNVCDHRSLR